MANKKTFDREKMYRKIMPTYYDNNFALASDPALEQNPTEFIVADDYEPEVVEPAYEEPESTVVNFPTNTSHTKVATPAFPENKEPSFGFNDAMTATRMRAQEMERIRAEHDNIAIYNLTEKIIIDKLDMVMESMNCCKCDRCKMDVMALTLNNMDPYYIVRASNSPDYTKLEKEISDKATSAVLKSALKVRKNPRH